MRKPDHIPERRDFDKRKRAAFDEFEYILPLLRDVRDFFAPRLGSFRGEDRKGERYDTRVYNERAIFAARTLAQGMASGMTPRSRPWNRLLPPDPEMADYAPVKTWLHDNADMMAQIHLRSNTYGTLYSCYGGMGKFGTDAFGVFDDFEDVIRTYRYPIGTWAFTVDHTGRPNGFYHECKKTVDQLVEQYGLANVPRQARTDYDNGDYMKKHTVTMAIERNMNRDRGMKDAMHMEWLAVHYAGDELDGFLKVSGHRKFPVIIPKWARSDVTIWGDSPAMDVLGSVMQLQVQELVYAEGLEKSVNPPLQAPTSARDAFVNKQPGGVTYYDQMQGATQGIVPLYNVNLRLAELGMNMKEIEARISEGMFADLFMMISSDDKTNRTAMEIAERKEEKLLALGPVLEGVDNDLLDPLIDLTYDAMQRAGLVPEPPPELQEMLNGRRPDVEYISILHQAQRAVMSQPIERYAAFVGSQMQAFPDVRFKYDPLQAADEYASAIGVPPRVVPSDEQVEAAQAAERQAAEQQQAMDQAMQAAQGAKLLSETQVNQGNSALDALLGTA